MRAPLNLVLGLLATVSYSACAHAQSVAGGDQSPDTATTPIETVVVTAEKRTERLVDVPMSISVVSGDLLSQANIGSTGDLSQVVPGLVTVSNGLSFTPAIRGISSVGTSPGDESNVSLYLDDVYMGATIAGLFDFKDIERIEVLKGPQGTLFGRNATGGAIRVVTKAPSFSPELEASADYGFSFDELKLNGYATGPITDNLAASLSAFYVTNNGYVRGIGPVDSGHQYATSHNYSLRGKALFTPSSDLSMTLSVDWSDRDDNAIYSIVPVDGQTAQKNVPGVAIPNPFEISSSTQPVVKVENRGISLDVNWDNPAVTVRSVTAYRQADGDYQTDNDRTNISTTGGRFAQGQRTFSQEFDFTGPAEDTVSWIAGLYAYFSESYLPYFNLYSGDVGGPLVSSFGNNVTTTSYAGFGELKYNVTDKLSLTGGFRYTWEGKRLNYFDNVRAAGLRTAIDQHDWASPSFRAVAKYAFNDSVNAYASVSTGFKSGVYNSYSYPVNVVNPEKITAYEVGAKAIAMGFTFTGAVFHYNYRDIQVQAQNNVEGVLIVTLTNAARAEVTGVELDASGNLTENISINAGVSLLPQSNYTDFTSAQVFIPNASGGATGVTPYDASGSRLIRAPRVQANGRVAYTHELFGGAFSANASYAYNSGFNWQAGDLIPESAYGILNSRISWTDDRGVFTYSVWGQNLTDAVYSMYTPVGSTGVSAAYARPRLIGIGISASL